MMTDIRNDKKANSKQETLSFRFNGNDLYTKSSSNDIFKQFNATQYYKQFRQ